MISFPTPLAISLLPLVAGWSALPADTVVLNVGYETGTLDSGVTGLGSTNATAPDAAVVTTAEARSGDHSVYHKVTLDDPAYVSDGKPRSESDTASLVPTRYVPGVHALYTVSFMLKDWQDWNTGDATPVDVLWQFKHTDGGPDAFVGVRRNSLIFRYGSGSGQATIIGDIRPLDNTWIDLSFDVLWSNTGDGYFKVSARSGSQTVFTQVVDIENYSTFSDNGSGGFGYLKWGLYRPDSESTGVGTAVTREVYHDNITETVVSAVPEPSTYGAAGVFCAGFAAFAKRRRRA